MAEAQGMDRAMQLGLKHETDMWETKGGKYAIHHHSCERLAREHNIRFHAPSIVVPGPHEVVMVVTGHLGDAEEWSIGEASVDNTKNKYLWSMAEKRGKDRVILKLLGIHGLFYSDEEADDFKREVNSRWPSSVMNRGAGKDIWGMAMTQLSRLTTIEEFSNWVGHWIGIAAFFPPNFEFQFWSDLDAKLRDNGLDRDRLEAYEREQRAKEPPTQRRTR